MSASRRHTSSASMRSSLYALACSLTAGSAQADQLIVDVTGVNVISGNIRAAVFDSRQRWDDEQAPVARASESVVREEVRIVFADLPAGDYAVKLYQDENGNDKLDTNMLGIPSERYGFSRQQPRRGQPSFADAKFTVDGDTYIKVPLN